VLDCDSLFDYDNRVRNYAFTAGAISRFFFLWATILAQHGAQVPIASPLQSTLAKVQQNKAL
jgi:hypothetical protein